MRTLTTFITLSLIALFPFLSVAEPPSVTEKPRSVEPIEKLLRFIDSTQENVLLEFLNCQSDRGLADIDGVARVRAEALVEARPFNSLREVADVKGIGTTTFTKIVMHLELLEGGGVVNLEAAGLEALLCK